MEALLTYLRETRTTPKSFANMIGVDAERVARFLAGEEPVSFEIAQRMIDATGGALTLEDLAVGAHGRLFDLRSRFSADAPDIDVKRLAEILAILLPDLVGGARRKGDDRLPGLAAEAAVGTYAALSTITTRSGEARLAQALRPIVAEILAELAASVSRPRLDETVQRAARLYFQARPEKRRA